MGRREPVGGTLRSAARRLDAIAGMGFDVVYLPPVHPIGSTFRKGRNNALRAGPGDPGSPWAIGSPDGGHDAVHPQLGTLAGLDALVGPAPGPGLEVALDPALQTPPDPPSVTSRPDWVSYRAFTWRSPADELTEYLRELAGPAAAYMRPNFFANTPDILNEYLQYGGPPAFRVRAVLAALLSPSWGIYSGYELCENVPVRPGSEEHLDSEKYAYRQLDWCLAEP